MEKEFKLFLREKRYVKNVSDNTVLFYKMRLQHFRNTRRYKRISLEALRPRANNFELFEFLSYLLHDGDYGINHISEFITLSGTFGHDLTEPAEYVEFAFRP